MWKCVSITKSFQVFRADPACCGTPSVSGFTGVILSALRSPSVFLILESLPFIPNPDRTNYPKLSGLYIDMLFLAVRSSENAPAAPKLSVARLHSSGGYSWESAPSSGLSSRLFPSAHLWLGHPCPTPTRHLFALDSPENSGPWFRLKSQHYHAWRAPLPSHGRLRSSHVWSVRCRHLWRSLIYLP